jgi:hypothetical protein
MKFKLAFRVSAIAAQYSFTAGLQVFISAAAHTKPTISHLPLLALHVQICRGAEGSQ